MHIMQCLSFLTIFAMVLVHGMWPEAFIVDRLMEQWGWSCKYAFLVLFGEYVKDYVSLNQFAA